MAINNTKDGREKHSNQKEIRTNNILYTVTLFKILKKFCFF